MSWLQSFSTRSTLPMLLLPLLAVVGCSSEHMAAPDTEGTADARGGRSGLLVRLTVPDTGSRNTTLDVRVLGSGFDPGSRAVWALNGDTTFATTGVRTNATRFVRSSELVANITIDEESPLESYDVIVVSAGGKKGIGIELFVVTDETIVSLGFALGMDIDEEGRIAGWQGDVASGFSSLLWTPATPRGMTGSSTPLTGLGGESFVVHLNETLQVAGTSFNGTVQRAVVWDGGTPHVLGEPAGATFGSAEDISDESSSSGPQWVAGIAGFASGSLPLVWRVTGTGPSFEVVSRATLPVPSGGSGQAFAVNNSGLIVGDAAAAGAELPLPAKWAEDGAGTWQRTSLALLVGETSGQALNVNAGGDIVGHNNRAGAGACSRGVVWPADALPPVPLPDLAGGTCSWASAINDAGYITGSARKAQGGDEAVLWVPQAGRTYLVVGLGRLIATASSQGRSLNEPTADGSGGLTLEVVGHSNAQNGVQKATLWTVKLP